MSPSAALRAVALARICFFAHAYFQPPCLFAARVTLRSVRQYNNRYGDPSFSPSFHLPLISWRPSLRFAFCFKPRQRPRRRLILPNATPTPTASATRTVRVQLLANVRCRLAPLCTFVRLLSTGRRVAIQAIRTGKGCKTTIGDAGTCNSAGNCVSNAGIMLLTNTFFLGNPNLAWRLRPPYHLCYNGFSLISSNRARSLCKTGRRRQRGWVTPKHWPFFVPWSFSFSTVVGRCYCLDQSIGQHGPCENDGDCACKPMEIVKEVIASLRR